MPGTQRKTCLPQAPGGRGGKGGSQWGKSFNSVQRGLAHGSLGMLLRTEARGVPAIPGLGQLLTCGPTRAQRKHIPSSGGLLAASFTHHPARQAAKCVDTGVFSESLSVPSSQTGLVSRRPAQAVLPRPSSPSCPAQSVLPWPFSPGPGRHFSPSSLPFVGSAESQRLPCLRCLC